MTIQSDFAKPEPKLLSFSLHFVVLPVFTNNLYHGREEFQDCNLESEGCLLYREPAPDTSE